ncbi:MAG: GNAT family N-acetyltransferase [Roseivirga sp.]|nr:GNAT family N-acetyltransferase [Roseivirga sp.]
MRVKLVESQQELDQAFKIREKVFREDLGVEWEDIFDQYDQGATHFIAYSDDEPAGSSRYRRTEKGVRLERFAVLPQYRGKGVGKRLVQSNLGHIEANLKTPGLLVYLHAQLEVMALYGSYGFYKVGEVFLEANLEHFEMRKQLVG